MQLTRLNPFTENKQETEKWRTRFKIQLILNNNLKTCSHELYIKDINMLMSAQHMVRSHGYGFTPAGGRVHKETDLCYKSNN